MLLVTNFKASALNAVLEDLSGLFHIDLEAFYKESVSHYGWLHLSLEELGIFVKIVRDSRL